ncbi:MAG: hypothetical protein JRN35_08655 [Nitrososphaerota archaeon]|nr:hypothetical protein [Nitrososphaerota archaeon]
MLPGDSPYQGAMFLHEGWTVIVFDDPPGTDFLCSACYDKIDKTDESDSHD